MRNLIANALRHPLASELTEGKTLLVRLFFAAVSFGWVSYILTDTAGFAMRHPTVVEYVAAPNKLGILFSIYASAVMYGVFTGRYSFILLLVEGFLGIFLWGSVGIADWANQGAPGPTFFAAIVALFLLARYPTHYQKGYEDD